VNARGIGRLTACAALLGLGVMSAGATADTTSIFFDGDEPGVNPGGGDFSFGGANFIQGLVTDFPGSALRASDPNSWLPQGGIAGNAMITFDVPVTEVTFYYVHDGIDVGAGAVGAFDDGRGDPVDSASSNPATFPGDPNNFVTLSSPTGFNRLEFIALDGLGQPGSVDNFTFTTIPAPGAAALLGVAGLVAGRSRRRSS